MTDEAATTTATNDGYRRALDADGGLRALDAAVRIIAARKPKTGPQCAGCVWEMVVKPLVSPLVGWERGRAPEQAVDPGERRSWRPVPLTLGTVVPRSGLGELSREPSESPTSDIEQWLRTSAAYDAVTNVWLDLLDAADPGRGHGFVRNLSDTREEGP